MQQEDYALSLMQRAGLPSPQPYGVAELTPEREYLIVFEFLDGATEIGQAEIDDAIIDQGLATVRKLWEANLAHRDIKPANLLVRDGKLYLIDVFFAQLHPSPWRQAVDLANMLLCLGLRAGPQRVYERALRQFSVGEITEAFAAARGLALPSQLRRMMRDQGRDLAAEFVRLLPAPPRPVAIQRWSARRVALLLLVALVVIPIAVPMAWVFAASARTRAPGPPSAAGAAPAPSLRSCGCRRRPCRRPPASPASRHSQQAPTAGSASATATRCCRSPAPASTSTSDIADRPRLVAEGGTVTIQLTATCAIPAAAGGQAIAPGVTRFQIQEPADRPGRSTYSPAAASPTGQPDGGASVALLGQAQRAVTYRTRDDLREALRRRSDGRLELDPAGGSWRNNRIRRWERYAGIER